VVSPEAGTTNSSMAWVHYSQPFTLDFAHSSPDIAALAV
jgi:hypothetical protein